MINVTRISEIWIGIVCADIVVAVTDFGGAPRRLAALFGRLLYLCRLYDKGDRFLSNSYVAVSS